MPVAEESVYAALRQVHDPELMVNIVDLGLIYEVAVEENEAGQSRIDVKMTMTSPACPAAPEIIREAKDALGGLPDTQVLVGLATLDENGYVISDEKMAVSETPGLFIAGDCRIKSVRQLTTAVSDGTVAAVSACTYLEQPK